MMDVPATLTDSDSDAPSGRLVIVAFAEARLALSASVTVAFGARTTAPPPSVKAAATPVPATTPLRSTTGGWLNTTFFVATLLRLLDTAPSSTWKLIVRVAGLGLPAESL